MSLYTAVESKRKTDWLLVLLYFLLVGLGISAIYSANYDPTYEINSIWDLQGIKVGKQLAWVAVTLVVVFFLQLFDRQFYVGMAPVLYVVTLLLLVSVLIFGREIAGSLSWIVLGPVRFQPSEFAKFASCLMVAFYLSGMNINLRKLPNFLITSLIILLPFGLVVLQGDAGTALVYTAFLLVLYREGLSGWFLVLFASVIALFILTLVLTTFDPTSLEVLKSGSFTLTTSISVLMIGVALFLFRTDWIQSVIVAVAALVIYFLPSLLAGWHLLVGLGVVAFIGFFAAVLIDNIGKQNGGALLSGILASAAVYIQTISYICTDILQPYQLGRILVLLGVVDDAKGMGYNLNQSLIAIGSGGLTGKGYLNGTQIRGDFVPESDTDFIFCGIGEEMGFVGSVIVIVLFVLLFLRIIAVAERQKSNFTRIYAYGVASILFFHFWINVAMTIGLAPVIGIPLPLISYGGSSFLGFSILLFILIRLDSDKKNVVR